MADLNNTNINDTGFIKIPSGTMAQRPSSPTEGMFRSNTELGIVEYWNGNAWVDAVTHKAPIISDSLQLHLDGTTIESDFATYNQWRDQSGNNRHASRFNNVNFTKNNGGGLKPEATDQRVEVPNFSNVVDFTQEQTISIYMKFDIDGVEYGRTNPYNQAYGGEGTITTEGGPTRNKSISYYHGQDGANRTPYQGFNSGGGVIANNELIFMTVTRSSITGLRVWYINGEAVTTATGTLAAVAGTSPIVIGEGYAGDYLPGEIYDVKLYNRALSPEEVKQNYYAVLSRNAKKDEYGPPINNLRLYLDAADGRSYPGYGTTWFDLSGKDSDVDMVNSGNISWNGGGYFSLSTTGYFQKSNSGILSTGNPSYTFVIIARKPTTWGDDGLITFGDQFGTSNAVTAFRTYQNTVGSFRTYWWGNDFDNSNNLAPVGLNEWFMAATTYDGSTREIFVNNVQFASQAASGHNVTNTNLLIGKTYSSEYLDGDIAVALVYDKALDKETMSLIYDHYRDRYGLP